MMNNNAMTPEAVAVKKQTNRLALIEKCVKDINDFLVRCNPNPGGHWDVKSCVYDSVAEEVASQFRARGWKVSYNLDPHAYSTYFNIEPAEKLDGPYR